MDELTLRLIHLDHCRGVGRKTITAFRKADPFLSHVADYSLNDLTGRFFRTQSAAEQFLRDYHAFNPHEAAARYEAEGISAIPVHSEAYPEYLKHIYDPPHLLYVKGRGERLKDRKMLSVVGTRHPTPEAFRVMDDLLRPLVESGWTIVSGMALGVDGFAHRIALSGRTIAVLGSGLYFPYPARHRKLFSILTEKHLVISEYPPTAKPERWRFPERNRLISGLSLGLLVVEAQERSGSLITADQALEQGREVMAVPGSVLQENSRGTNRLIQLGAKLVLDSHDILEELQIGT